jgi:hypothetical protein
MSIGHSGITGSWHGLRPLLAVLRRHFAARPLRPHFLVWAGIGMALGIAMTPDYGPISLIAFLFTGLMASSLIGLATYPLSYHHWATLLGAVLGAAMTLIAWSMRVEFQTSVPAVFMMTGALLGGTAFVWLAPTHWFLTNVLRSLRQSEGCQH